MIVIESAGVSDVGKKRKGNEDSLFLDDNMGLYVVADGMGGHQAGEVASLLVVKTMEDYIKRFKCGKTVEELADSDKTLSKEANRLISGINLSNQVVFQASRNKSSYRGMGATVSAVYFTEDTLIAANVGDSPIYLIRNGTIELLSVTHTVLAEQKAMNPSGASQLGRGFSHMLTRAMGIEDSVRADLCEIQCFKEDVVVIASDGLSDKLLPEDILEILNHKPPGKACQDLVDTANQRGGDDNITVIVIKVKAVNHARTGVMGFIFKLINMITK
ncbi:MAG: hypothetical protein BWK80_19165 [Desulfobacteraceae bacterium IS3]|nr:MAG: hypothetical protein BWK80_19165 [Desulfobacteraceae bacterium IS3]